MSSRESILKAVRANQPPAHPLPDLSMLNAMRFDDLASRFDTALQAVAGTCESLDGPDALAAAIRTRYPDATRVISTVENVPGTEEDTHTEAGYHGLDLLVLNGGIGVAENGAIWVDGSQFPHQSVLFLAEHMVIVVPRAALVHNMHEAYGKLTEAKMPPFGVFVAGPSKTADIEQSLVIGAQGARSCHVYLV